MKRSTIGMLVYFGLLYAVVFVLSAALVGATKQPGPTPGRELMGQFSVYYWMAAIVLAPIFARLNRLSRAKA